METLKIGIAQTAPVWLHREQTLEKILACVADAAHQESSGREVGGEEDPRQAQGRDQHGIAPHLAGPPPCAFWPLSPPPSTRPT